MNITKKFGLLVAAGIFAVTPSINGQTQVTLIEQTISFKLKLTTLNVPVVKVGLTEVSATLNTLSGTVTTKDVLKTLGFSSTAKLVGRVVADTSVSPANLYVRILVKQGGAEFDVTDTLSKLVPIEDPIAALRDAVFKAGVVKGKVKASWIKGVTSSLNTLSYGDGSGSLNNLSVASVALGDLSIDGAGLSKGTVSLSGGIFSGVSLGVSTTTTVIGGAILSDTPKFGIGISVPAVVEGTITTKGNTKIPTLGILQLVDLGALLDELD